jgi:small subunit ribosomal protein S2
MEEDPAVTEEERREEEEVTAEDTGLLLPIEALLSAGIHIGTRINTKDMEAFIYRVRPDGLFVLDVKKTDDRIRIAAKFLASFDPSRVIVVSTRLYGVTPVTKFCEVLLARPVTGRFLPGLFSNPNHSSHLEADVVVVTDPKADRQAVREAALVGIPVVALCDTDNDFASIDFVIPANNKGRRSLATIYWLLARQIQREKGEIPPDGDLAIPIDDFETKLVEARSFIE